MMMASHDNDGDEIERPASPFNLLNIPYSRSRSAPDEDEDGDIEMTDGDEIKIQADDAKNVDSQNSLLSKISAAASAYIPSTVAHTTRKFASTHSMGNICTQIQDPACSPPGIKEPLYSKSEVQAIRDSILAGSGSSSESSQGPPISLRDHASLQPATPHQPSGNPQEDNGDDIPLGTLKSLLAARQHLADVRDELIANPASKWIDIPEKSVSDDVGSRTRTEQRVFEPREDPKEVLMEGLYPGEGKRFLDWIDEVVKKSKSRPWRIERRASRVIGDWKL